MREAYFIFYVRNQTQSAAYYGEILDLQPILDVPGITEFQLLDGSIFAVMPLESAARLIGEAALISPDAPAVTRAELYLVVDDPDSFHARALEGGATELSPMQVRDWGHRAAYSMDADGHVLAFAEKIRNR